MNDVHLSVKAIFYARFANTALAVWPLVSCLVLPAHTATIWNNVAVALLLFATSLVPGDSRPLIVGAGQRG